jgi:hypothetical protein
MEETVSLGNFQSLEWRKRIGCSVAKYNFCRPLLGRGRIYFIGTRGNVEVVKEIFAWILEQAVDLANRSLVNKPAGEDTRRWKLQFVTGIATTIERRLRDQ